jgi:hypothetical protein
MFVFMLKWAGIILAGWLTLSVGVAAIYATISYGQHRREEEVDELAFRGLTHAKQDIVNLLPLEQRTARQMAAADSRNYAPIAAPADLNPTW